MTLSDGCIFRLGRYAFISAEVAVADWLLVSTCAGNNYISGLNLMGNHSVQLPVLAKCVSSINLKYTSRSSLGHS